MMHRPSLRTLWLTAVPVLVLALAGCSTNEPFEQPAPVPELEATVELDSTWRMSVGDGTDDQFLHLTPLVRDDALYVVSADGELISVSTSAGEVRWERELDRAILAGVGGDNSHLYVVTRNAVLLALSRENGELVWEADLPNEVIATPGANGSIVVAQTTDGKVLAFDATTGEKRWQYDGVVPALSLRMTAQPLVGNDAVLVSFANGRLLALSGESGQPLWQYAVGEPTGRTELERLVDVTSRPLILENTALITGYQGKLALVDLRNGQEIWSRAASSLHSPALARGNIYLSLSNGDLVAYEGSTRRELWTQDALAWRQPTQPVVVGDYLLVGDFEGYIHILSLEDGSLQGQLEFDDDGIRVPMQALGNSVLVYGNSGKLAVLELKPLD